MPNQTPNNPAKERMGAGGVALGMIVRLARSGEIARIARATGHDFLFIDGQHALFSRETVGHICEAASGCGVSVLVRVRSCDDPDISLMLDAGASGIIVPDVNTAEEARRAVRAARFAPIGKRSLPGPMVQYDFGPVPADRAVREVNEATLLVCMIETREGVENAAAIAAVEGVDVLHVGCVDLLLDMGKPGAFGDPEAQDAIARVLEAAQGAQKFAGVGGDRDPARVAGYLRAGARFLTTGIDLSFLMTEASRVAAELRRL